MNDIDNMKTLVDEVEDFELTGASYQVWGFYLDEEYKVLTEVLLKDFNDPDDAVAYAKIFVSTVSSGKVENLAAAYYEVIVETVVDFGDYEENVATLFKEVVKL